MQEGEYDSEKPQNKVTVCVCVCAGFIKAGFNCSVSPPLAEPSTGRRAVGGSSC